MKIIDVKQGTDEWRRARLGIPTASQFDRIITPKTGKLSAQAEDYIFELIGETMGYPIVDEGYASPAMERGIALEPEARAFYEMHHGVRVDEVGLCLSDDGKFGCSPDGYLFGGELIGDAGLEIKCPSNKIHCSYLFAGVLPDAYKAQVHGSLIVTGALWWDFLSYCPGLPPFSIRVYPDEFTLKLRAAMNEFDVKYQAAKAKMAEMEAA